MGAAATSPPPHQPPEGDVKVSNTGEVLISRMKHGYLIVGGHHNRIKAKSFPDTEQGMKDAILYRDEVLSGRQWRVEKPKDLEPKYRVLNYTPHRDDFSDPGPKASTVGRRASRESRGEHRELHDWLSVRGLLRPGDEIKTSRDSVRDVLGAAAHMLISHKKEGAPLGRLFLNRVVDDTIRGFVTGFLGIEIIEIPALVAKEAA